MNNTEGPRVEASKAYGDKIKEIFGIPVDYQDERFDNCSSRAYVG